ncbi:MAG: ester cyclase [Acidimicrobiia bacterium]
MGDTASLHRDMFDAVVKRDWEGLRALYHADYSYMDGTGVETKGAEAGLAVAQGYTTAFPDLTFEIRNQYTDGPDISIVEFTARGTHQAELDGIAATGKSVEIFVCNVIVAQDGKILREREYFDNLAILQQLGVAPA